MFRFVKIVWSRKYYKKVTTSWFTFENWKNRQDLLKQMLRINFFSVILNI